MAIWLAAFCSLFLNAIAASPPRTPQPRPNILLIISDDQAWTDFGFMGHSTVRTPNLDRLAALVRWPGTVQSKTDPHPISSVDLFPTLLAATHTPVPEGLPGINLFNPRAIARRNAVQGACFTHDAVDLENPALGLRWRWRIEGDWKLILPNPSMEPGSLPELYNLRKDPLEQFDRAALERRKVRRLRESLNRWWPGN